MIVIISIVLMVVILFFVAWYLIYSNKYDKILTDDSNPGKYQVEPAPFTSDFDYNNVYDTLKMIKFGFKLPFGKGTQYFLNNIMYEYIIGPGGKIYGVFIHMPKHKITYLCWLSFKYLKHWKCVLNNHLVKIYDEIEGRVWDCIKNFYNSVRDQVWDIWNKFKPETKQLVVCGYSLGGAFAPISALDLKMRDSSLNNDNLFVIIFAAPYIGDQIFVKEYDKLIPNTFNIRNVYDIVPLTPPYNMYEHVGKSILFSENVGLRNNHRIDTYLTFFKNNVIPLQSKS